MAQAERKISYTVNYVKINVIYIHGSIFFDIHKHVACIE